MHVLPMPSSTPGQENMGGTKKPFSLESMLFENSHIAQQ
jgi:hypothetical protein